jgi:fumarate hydratase class II
MVDMTEIEIITRGQRHYSKKQEPSMKYREETDSLGTVRVPEDAYYGPQTQRAIENFPVSGLTLPDIFLRSVAMIKKHAASVNQDLGLISAETGKSIIQACEEIMTGKLKSNFPVDVFQTGSGTSTNMNLNEVIACRANEILTGKKSGKAPVHPNDHVNCCQSSNDVIPSAIHISAAVLIRKKLTPALETLFQELDKKAAEFQDIHKIGRTHLQDAVIMTLGNEFSGYARQVRLALDRLDAVRPRLYTLALGGTAVGTGLNAHPDFASRVIVGISEETGLPFVESTNHFESQGACDTAVEVSGILKTIGVSFSKIANDIRWLASGPRCGLGEIRLPELQPGSSIMPGKINPVIPESVIQVCAQVMGNDTTISIGGTGGYFELNTMLPLIACNLIQSIALLGAAAEILAKKCVSGITANAARCRNNIENSLGIVTSLVPHIGYDRAAEIAKKAFAQGKTIETVAREENILPEKELKTILFGTLF